jgi:hypothetical protein
MWPWGHVSTLAFGSVLVEQAKGSQMRDVTSAAATGVLEGEAGAFNGAGCSGCTGAGLGAFAASFARSSSSLVSFLTR